ncbi:MFS superfamily sulfate permease-like transporter [Bradyrhizobium sp. LB7.2]
MSTPSESKWKRFFPPAGWLAAYRREWLPSDAVAGVTLAAYAIPVSLAYAALAGLPPQIGVYGYMLGGIGYALLGSSRQLAIGPTSAISLMIASTVGALASGDAARYAQIASLAAFAVAVLCFIAWLFKLSVLVRLVSDSILVGFKAGAGLTIIMSQLPSLLGVAGGGHNFFDRAIELTGQLGQIDPLVLAIGTVALLLLLVGERLLPGKPVGITVVALAIMLATLLGLPTMGVPVTGKIPQGLPALGWPTFGLLQLDDLFPLAAGCVLLAYIEGVSAARGFAAKHGYPLDVRQELLGLGTANLAASFGHGYPVAGGLSQSAVNDSAGARTQLALVICSMTLGLCLLYFTALLTNLPKAVLAAIVFAAVYRAGGCPEAVADVAGQPDRFLRRRNRVGIGVAARHPAGGPACVDRINRPAAGPSLPAERGVPRPFAWRAIFGPCEARRRRAAGRCHRVSPGSLIALYQRRDDPRYRPDGATHSTGYAAGGL